MAVNHWTIRFEKKVERSWRVVSNSELRAEHQATGPKKVRGDFTDDLLRLRAGFGALEARATRVRASKRVQARCLVNKHLSLPFTRLHL